MKVEWYKLPSGSIPARDYLDSLDKGLRSKTLRTISFLEERGHLIGAPDSKHLEDGIFELRTTMGDNTGRVLFFFCVGDKAVLTHGFKKKTQRTPRREIEKAKRYRTDYFARLKGAPYDNS